LLQQYYADQPTQRLFGVSFSADVSANGVSVFLDKDRVRAAIRCLIETHGVLNSTIHRDTTGAAHIERILSFRLSSESQHPLGPYPVSWSARTNCGTWCTVMDRATHTDMTENSWLFRIVILLADNRDGEKRDCGSTMDIVIVLHHLIADGMTLLVRNS
jgi:hypothetical protein